MQALKWDGGKIAQPGVYDMPIEAYHGDCCDGPSISSTGLREIETRSPAHYWAYSVHNPKRAPQESRRHFDVGKAAHALLLGEGEFAKRFTIRPTCWPDWRTKEARAWRDEQIKAGLVVLLPEDIDTIRGMRDSLADHPLVQQGILNGHVEKSLIWKDRETGIWLKSRPDVIPADPTIYADLKALGDCSPLAIRRAISDHGYHMQLALGGEGMRELLDIRIENYALMCVEKTPPFAVNFKPIDNEAIWYGARQNRRAIRKAAECFASGRWPAYDDDGITAHLTKYALDRLQKEDAAGFLPEITA